MAAHYVRRDVWKLPKRDRTLHWYGRAVTIMRARDDDDPTSWVFQANIHGSANLARRDFNRCKHGSWNFLAWHRLYLYYFERIVRAAVVEAGGPDTWALPFWNYEGAGRAATLPTAFREPADASNPLYVHQRRASYNAGTALRAEFTSSTAALATRHFTTPFGATSFGGGRDHDLLKMAFEPGTLEISPHNAIHSRIGGRTGWMNNLDLAARDPIFWLHHTNIDRLWTQWTALGAGRANPTAKKWLTHDFTFFDTHGKRVKNRAADALSTAMLHYAYEGVRPTRAGQSAVAVSRPRKPELVGSSVEPVALTGTAASAPVTVDALARAQAATRLAAGEPAHIYLNLDDVRADEAPGAVYGVYVNLPAGSEPDQTHYAGIASFFGITRAEHPGDAQAHGYRLSYDITELANRLTELGEWDEAHLQVSFHPLDEDEPEDTDHPPVTVGRVSIFHG